MTRTAVADDNLPARSVMLGRLAAVLRSAVQIRPRGATDEQAVREAVARKILGQRTDCPEHPPGLPKPSCWTCGRNGAFTRAARIALGTWP